MVSEVMLVDWLNEKAPSNWEAFNDSNEAKQYLEPDVLPIWMSWKATSDLLTALKSSVFFTLDMRSESGRKAMAQYIKSIRLTGDIEKAKELDNWLLLSLETTVIKKIDEVKGATENVSS